MNRTLLSIAMSLVVLAPSAWAVVAPKTNITVAVEDIQGDEGTVCVQLHSRYVARPNAHNKEAITKCIDLKTATEHKISFTDVPSGKYAVSVFHDRNGDGLLRAVSVFRDPEGVGYYKGRKSSLWISKFKHLAETFEGNDNQISVAVSY